MHTIMCPLLKSLKLFSVTLMEEKPNFDFSTQKTLSKVSIESFKEIQEHLKCFKDNLKTNEKKDNVHNICTLLLFERCVAFCVGMLC